MSTKGKRLTLKQRAFIADTVKYKNATKAVMLNYDVKNQNVARNIASENQAKPYIRESIEQHLQAVGYNPTTSLARLIATEEKGAGIKATASDSIRASELLLKLSGYLVEKRSNLNISMDIDNMDNGKLIKIKDKYKKIINSK